MLQSYIDTDTVDLRFLDDISWARWSNCDDSMLSRSPRKITQTLAKELAAADEHLTELQHAMEEIVARVMGSVCALQ